jgi:toxin ParE1/3/4
VLRLIWRETALEDLDRIVTYIGEYNFGAAERIQSLAEMCAERLVDHPYMHRAGRLPGTREAVIHPNYIVVYRVNSDSVEIVNILHTRRLYPPGD